MSRPLENVLLLESKMADIVLRDIKLTTRDVISEFVGERTLGTQLGPMLKLDA